MGKGPSVGCVASTSTGWRRKNLRYDISYLCVGWWRKNLFYDISHVFVCWQRKNVFYDVSCLCWSVEEKLQRWGRRRGVQGMGWWLQRLLPRVARAPGLFARAHARPAVWITLIIIIIIIIISLLMILIMIIIALVIIKAIVIATITIALPARGRPTEAAAPRRSRCVSRTSAVPGLVSTVRTVCKTLYHICMYIYIYIYTHICIHMSTMACYRIHTICICLIWSMYMINYVYIYIYRERENVYMIYIYIYCLFYTHTHTYICIYTWEIRTLKGHV